MITLKNFFRLLFAVVFSLLFADTIVNAGAKIIYIPLDSRPVCFSYVKQSVAAAGYELLTPPEKMLATSKHKGKPDSLWRWFKEASSEADAAVVATDSLLYGGLVESRMHNETEEKLFERVNNFAKLKEDYPGLKIYAFSTIMRTPRQSYGNVEPPYYSVYGREIFALSQLYDKEQVQGLTLAEKNLKEELLLSLPKKYLDDWFARRQKNYQVNELLADFARNKTFHYLALGKDDNAPLSQTHLESRHLMEATLDLAGSRFKILPGVDQLGLLLLTRTINELNHEKPVVHVIYSEGEGKNTLPLYSDQRLSSSVPDQVLALGGALTENPYNADLILAVNTPFDGITKDSTADDNLFFSSIHNKRFVKQINNFVGGSRTLAIADVSYANGSDNGFMEELSRHVLLGQLAAYSGWNTADNTIGYALAQGVLSSKMKKADKDMLLRARYLDDWLYQSNIRPVLVKLMKKYDSSLIYDFGSEQDDILVATYEFYDYYLEKDSFLRLADFELSFPWNRLFEINVAFKK